MNVTPQERNAIRQAVKAGEDGEQLTTFPAALGGAILSATRKGLLTIEERPWRRVPGQTLTYVHATDAGRAAVANQPKYAVGDQVRSDKFLGRSDFADLATVEEIRTRPAVLGGGWDYIIRWDEVTDRPTDLPLVSRSADALRPV